MNLLGLPPYQRGRKRSKRRSKAEIEDEAYRYWVQRQPSCITGRFSEFLDGEWLNPACHVRRSSGSGIAYKPLLSAVPLTHQEHRLQHDQAELACLRAYLPFDQLAPILAADDPVQAAKDWFDDQAARYLSSWIRTPNRKDDT